jgi:hypothetical protein
MADTALLSCFSALVPAIYLRCVAVFLPRYFSGQGCGDLKLPFGLRDLVKGRRKVKYSASLLPLLTLVPGKEVV